MTKANITQYSATASSNTDIDDINIDENCPASGLNNALRSLMAHLKNVDTGTQALTALSVTGAVGTGVLSITGSSGDLLNVSANSGTEFALRVDGNEVSFKADADNDESNSTITFDVDGSEAMRISSGNLLVTKTATNYQTVGVEAKSTGQLFATADGNNPIVAVRKSSDGKIQTFFKDTTEVGSIHSQGGDSFIVQAGAGSGSGLHMHGANGVITPARNGAVIDNAIDLGGSSNRFKDLYLSGGVFLGGTGSANQLSDVETGTWTPAILNGWGVTSPTYSQQTGFYTKIGNVCHISFRIGLSGGSINSNRLTVEGLPFSAGSNTSGTLWTGNGYFSTASSSAENVFLKIVDNGVYPSFHYRQNTGTAEFTGTNAGSGFNLTFSGSYFTT